MNEEMLNLKPAKVFYYFNEITKIPRPSKREEKKKPARSWGCPPNATKSATY